MVKKYNVTCWLDCEWCFTKKYTDEEILSIVYNNMPDEDFEDLMKYVTEASNGKITKCNKENFIKWARIDWNSFHPDNKAMEDRQSVVNVAIIVRVEIDIDQFKELQ